MVEIKSGDTVIILANLPTQLIKLGFTNPRALDNLIGEKRKVLDTHQDDEQNPDQWYATVDICQEVPFQCLHKVEEEVKS